MDALRTGRTHTLRNSTARRTAQKRPAAHPIITPTTKATGGQHDQRLTREEILAGGLIPPALWEQVEAAALAIFARGQAIAEQTGLILVDTKYEFGLINGQLALIDEVHTPDSSRYWIRDSYQPGDNAEPANFDKEFLRVWFADRGYRGEGTPPAMPADFIARSPRATSRRMNS